MELGTATQLITRLIILWLLSERPLHGYRIKRILADVALRHWFPIETGSIYSVLKTLAAAGLVETEIVEREGQRPERTQFRITQAGREHYRELLRRAWTEVGRSSESFHLALAARSDLDESEIPELLAIRVKSLRQRISELEMASNSAPALAMVEHSRALTLADLTWTESELEKLNNRGATTSDI